MSWLSDQLERPGLRPFPVGPLAARLGIVEADPEFTARLSERLGLDRGWVLRCRKLGLTLAQADEWATHAGVHPAEIWAGYSRGLVGVALANANRTHCRCGRRYDRVDRDGFRRCSHCLREAKRRYRESVNGQVVALFPRTGVHARHHGWTVTDVDAEELPDDDWLTVNEVAEALRVNRRAVYEACARGELPHVRVGRVIRVSRSALVPTTAPRVAS